MSTTPRAGITEIAASQSQKEATANEAFRLLEQLATRVVVKDKDLATPPGSPAEGDAYYLPNGSLTGAWAGHGNDIAFYQNSAWRFIDTQLGWRIYALDEDVEYTVVSGSPGPLRGDNATSMTSHLAASDPHPQYVLEASIGQVGGVQAYSQILAMLVGSASYGFVKLSAGSPGPIDITNRIETEAGSASLPAISGPTANDGIFFPAASSVAFSSGGVERMRVVGARLVIGHTASVSVGGVTPPLQVHATAANGFSFSRWSNDVNAPVSTFGKSRGASIGTFGAVTAGDSLGALRWAGDDGSSIVTSANLALTVEGVVSTGVVRSRYDFQVVNSGGTLTNALRLVSDSRAVFGASPVDDGSNTVQSMGTIAAAGSILPGSFTVATLPAAGTSRRVAFCSDLGGGGGLVVDNGSQWERCEDAGIATVNTDVDFTLTPLSSAPTQVHTGTLTADRTITLSTTGAYNGSRFRVTRTGAGAFNLSVGGLKNLVTNTWAIVEYSGSAWTLIAYGAL